MLDSFSRSCRKAAVAAVEVSLDGFSRCYFQGGFSSTRAPSASGSGFFLLSTSVSSEAKFMTPSLSTSRIGGFSVERHVLFFFRPSPVPITPIISNLVAKPVHHLKNSSSAFHGHESFVYHEKKQIPQVELAPIWLGPSTSNLRPQWGLFS